MENKVRFRIKREYYLELLTSETVELFGSSKSKIIKDKNGESVLHLKIAEVVLAIVIFSTTIINKIQESCIHLFLINHLVNY